MTLIDITDQLLITKRFRTAIEFSTFIESKVVDENIGYMEAIIAYCDENDIDVESISPLVSKSLKDKIRLEAEELNYLKVTAKLPV